MQTILYYQHLIVQRVAMEHGGRAFPTPARGRLRDSCKFDIFLRVEGKLNR